MSAAPSPAPDSPSQIAELDVVEESARWREAGLDPEALAAAGVAAACAEVGVDPGRPAAIVFADDALLQSLNARHRGKDKPTNVLAFPAPKLPGMAAQADAQPLGDVILAFETVAEEAETFGISLKARSLHMVIHGYLHLLGYDHETEDEAELMESMERRSLARLQIADPYEARDHA